MIEKFEIGKKYKTTVAIPGCIEAGVVVTPTKDKNTDTLERGAVNPERVFCSTPSGGALFFHPSEVEEI